MFYNRFHPHALRPIRLGQADASWLERARRAVAGYDSALERISRLPADARAEVMSVVGDGTIPGTPSDRYRFVREAVARGGPWDDVHQGYVLDLEDANVKLSLLADEGESLSASGALATQDGKLTNLGLGILAISVIGLFIVPFVFEFE